MKERTLLLYSEVIKQFPEIHRLLEENEDITDEFVCKLPEEQRNFFDNILPVVLKQAASEWRGNPKRLMEDMGPNEDDWLHCSLDNQPNRYIFYIENILNGTTLNVGSECVKHFWDGSLKGKSVAQLKREATRLKRLNDLNDKIPGIARTIESWGSIIQEALVIIPNSLEKPYLDLGRKAKDMLESYLSSKFEVDYFNEFRQILEKRHVFANQINEYIKNNQMKRDIPTKEIRIWLENNNLTNVLEQLKNDGKITWGTAHRIEEIGFMKSIVEDLNRGLLNIGFNIINVDSVRKGYVLEPIRGYKIKLFSKHKNLVFYCGWIIFNEEPIEPFTLEGVLQQSSLYNEEDIDIVLKRLKALSFGLEIVFEDVDHELNEVIVFDRKADNYVIINLKYLAEEFKGLVVGASDKTIKDLASYIHSIKEKRYTKTEIKDIKRIREEYNKRTY
ncbi:MAG: hypothetical protein K6T65_16055 [Peptococcaceae bacterium]|nr:hypothetical protein [Peptococcaceae bacterium]